MGPKGKCVFVLLMGSGWMLSILANLQASVGKGWGTFAVLGLGERYSTTRQAVQRNGGIDLGREVGGKGSRGHRGAGHVAVDRRLRVKGCGDVNWGF